MQVSLVGASDHSVCKSRSDAQLIELEVIGDYGHVFSHGRLLLNGQDQCV